MLKGFKVSNENILNTLITLTPSSTYMDWLKNTERIYFPNGLTLLLHPLQNSEAAALHFCVKAGYFCETDSEVGLAHLLEHMYFKGSTNFPEPGTLGVRMKALGGMINASTSYDQTNYYCEVPAGNLMPALEIMADAFAAPLFPDDELKKECEVVIEEFNRKLDNPSAYSQEMLIQLAYTKHRMKRWRIGTPEQLRSYNREHLFDYFYRYYQPQNMVVTVTGKFDSKAVRKAVEESFTPMKNRELLKDFGPEEPPQHGIRYAKRNATATQSYLHFGFHAPGVLHPDGPVIEFLAFLMSAGRSARLHRHVVERKRSASSASCYYLAYENVGLLMLTAITDPEKIREAASDSWSVLRDLQDNGIDGDELQKIRNKLRLYQAMQTEDALSLAELLSYYEAYGSYERIEEHLNRMQQITAEEIVQTSAKYLRTENLSVMEYVNGNVPDISSEEYKEVLLKGYVAPVDRPLFPDWDRSTKQSVADSDPQRAGGSQRTCDVHFASGQSLSIHRSRDLFSWRPQRRNGSECRNHTPHASWRAKRNLEVFCRAARRSFRWTGQPTAIQLLSRLQRFYNGSAA